MTVGARELGRREVELMLKSGVVGHVICRMVAMEKKAAQVERPCITMKWWSGARYGTAGKSSAVSGLDSETGKPTAVSGAGFAVGSAVKFGHAGNVSGFESGLD
jgi:hypothetical protein